jgi:hypothetical protein
MKIPKTLNAEAQSTQRTAERNKKIFSFPYSDPLDLRSLRLCVEKS